MDNKEFITQNYNKIPIEEICKVTGLKESSVRFYASKLGVSKQIKKKHPVEENVTEQEANITEQEVKEQRNSFVLSDEDKKYIDRHIGKLSLKEIAEKLSVDYNVVVRYTAHCGEDEMPRSELETKFEKVWKENIELKEQIKQSPDNKELDSLKKECEQKDLQIKDLTKQLADASQRKSVDDKEVMKTARLFMCAMLVFDTESDPLIMTNKCMTMAKVFHENIDQ